MLVDVKARRESHDFVQTFISYAIVSLCEQHFNEFRIGFTFVVPEGSSDPWQPRSRSRFAWSLSSLPCLCHRPAFHGTRPEFFRTRILSRGSEPHQVLAGVPRWPWPQPQEPWLKTFDSQGWPCWSCHSMLEGGNRYHHPINTLSLLLFAKFKLVILFLLVTHFSCMLRSYALSTTLNRIIRLWMLKLR